MRLGQSYRWRSFIVQFGELIAAGATALLSTPRRRAEASCWLYGRHCAVRNSTFKLADTLISAAEVRH